jgi:PAS domain S-box-containing protein
MNEELNNQRKDQALAAGIARNKQAIIETWRKKVRAENLSAKDKSDLAIIDSLPDLLDEMIRLLSSLTPEKEFNARKDIMAFQHGIERSHFIDYTVDQVIWEYNVLRNTIMEVVDPDGNLTLKQSKWLWDTIFVSIRNAIKAFSKIRQEEKQKLHDMLNEKNKTLQANLHESETMFRSIVNAVGDYAIFTIDINGFIDSWNSGAVRMYGLSAEEAIGLPSSALYPEDGNFRAEPMEHLKIASLEGRFRGEGLRIRKNLELFMADVYIIPIKRKDEIVGYAEIIQDLTEHNQLIQERDLSRVEANNLRIENELRETFVATLSHDLRNPLAAAKASAQIILKNPNAVERHLSLAAKIIEHVNRSDKMINNLLDVKKINAGQKIKLIKEECNLMELVNEVVHEITIVHGRKINIRGNPNVSGYWDHEAIRRILENLLTNAVKYGEQMTPIDVIFLEEDDRIQIKVHNFGKVIELPDQMLLFNKFHQLKTHDKTKGWGLGLTVVKGLVDAHHGVIQVESSPRAGTTFTVDLPRYAE